jgi:hypothetical protein
MEAEDGGVVPHLACSPLIKPYVTLSEGQEVKHRRKVGGRLTLREKYMAGFIFSHH